MKKGGEAEELRTNWRCRASGHHRWGYPDAAYTSRNVPTTQVCRRAGCDALRFPAVPGEDLPDTMITRYLTPAGRTLSVRQVMGWNWQGPDPTVDDWPPQGQKVAADE